jgi:hypothetical protein
LSLEGEVISNVTIKPKRIRFGDLGKSEKASKEFWVKLRNPDKAKIDSVTIEDKNFTVSHKGDDPEKGAQYEISFNGSPDFGRISTTMRVSVQGLDKPFKNVSVVANIAGNLRYPQRLFFFKQAEGFPSKNIVISTRDGAPVTIKKMADPDGLLKLQIEKNNEPTVQIQAQVANPDIKLDQRSVHKLIIRTTDKDEPTIELTYRIGDTKISKFRGDRSERREARRQKRAGKRAGKRHGNKSEVQP